MSPDANLYAPGPTRNGEPAAGHKRSAISDKNDDRGVIGPRDTIHRPHNQVRSPVSIDISNENGERGGAGLESECQRFGELAISGTQHNTEKRGLTMTHNEVDAAIAVHI